MARLVIAARAYYNEHNPFAAMWLRELIKKGLIADGDVDTRSIEDVTPGDLAGYTQIHLFAGIGGWSRALRLAGVADSARVFTASCPCQPFSAAGKTLGFADERHLWPAAFHLIKRILPPIVIGEQVASKDGLAWLDLVQTDMEATDYAFRAVDLCAAGVGAPHIRQRLYWVGLRKGALDNAANVRYNDEGQNDGGSPLRPSRSEQSGTSSALGIADRAGWLQGRPVAAPAGHGGSAEPASRLCGMVDAVHPVRPEWQPGAGSGQAAGRSGFDELADTSSSGLRPRGRRPEEGNGAGPAWEQPGRFRNVGESFWSGAEWIPCIDGKWRPIEAASAQPKLRVLADGVPGGLEQSGRADQPSQKAANEEARSTFPVVHGYPNRIGALRGYGNAIVPPLAAIFIQSVLGDKTT